MIRQNVQIKDLNGKKMVIIKIVNGIWLKEKKLQKNNCHPDLNHPKPIGPHLDYKSPEFPHGVRFKLDGPWEIKK